MSTGTYSDSQVHEWLQDIVENGWISLHYDNPAIDGFGGAEIGGGGYRRIQGVFSAPSNRTIWLLQDVIWTGLLQTSILYFGIWNDQYTGRLSASGKIGDTPVQILQGMGHVIRAGDLALSLG